jgi:UPF0716 protein FxsA
MFLLLPIGLGILEVVVFIEVARVTGWLWAVVLLLGTSLLGVRLLYTQGRAAIVRVSLAVAERRGPARAALDGALRALGCLLLVVPGFVTDVIGALLLWGPIRRGTRRWMQRHYAARVVNFVVATGRFVPGERTGRGRRPDDIESTAIDDDLDQLGR